MRESWREVSLRDVAQPVKDTLRPGTRADLPYVALEHVLPGNPRVPVYGRSADTVTPTTVFQRGDVLFSKLRPYLNKVAIAEGEGCCTGEILVWRTRNESVLLPAFLALVLRDSRAIHHAVAMSAGSRMPRTSTGQMNAYAVHLPPLEEQQRIVDLIESLDQAIEVSDAAVKSTRAAAVELRRATFESLAAEYSMDSAGEKFSILLGRQKSARQSVGDHVIPYVRAGNLSDGSLSLAVVQTMNFDPREQEKYCLEAGDVLIAEGGSVGQSAVWNGEIAGPVGFDKHVLRVRGVTGRSIGAYAFQWARWCYESGQFAAAATGITIKALGFDRAKRISVPAAPIAQQLEAVQHLTAVDHCAVLAAEFADSLRAMRAELLAVLLSGEHEIPESYDIDTAVQLESAA